MTALRTVAAVWSARAAAYGSRALGRGGGTAVSGLIGLALEPRLVSRLATGLSAGSVLVTGTNGKTTTARLIAETARAAGLQPLANASGSNLMRGLASTLALSTGLDGRLDGAGRLGVFEVDEASVRLAVPQLRPRLAVFTNLFRDQLDRYGEVEAVAALWRDTLAAAGDGPALVLNADDPLIASLGERREDAVYFGVEDASLDRGRVEHAADAVNCSCGARRAYDVAYFGHLGIWRCPACGKARPCPSVTASEIDLRDGRSLCFTLKTPAGASREEVHLGGLYNAYNALAAAAAAYALALPPAALTTALATAGAAFGRQEAFEVEGRGVEVFLGKNPAGLNQVLASLRLDPARRTLLVVLNDGIADGRDISWVWDADFEDSAGRFEKVVVSGSRCWDMALRLKHAGWEEGSLVVEEEIAPALAKAVSLTPAGACLSVVPTYTAMLAVRSILARRSGRAPFWSQG